jgi:chemotaxis protein CheD
MGDRNVAAAREALTRAGIAIAGEDVGGDFGRTVWVAVTDGTVTVQSVLRGRRAV